MPAMRLSPSIPLVLALLPVSSISFVQRNSGRLQASSCQRFVQQFYDWYAPMTQKDFSVPAYDIAVKRRPRLFSVRLREALLADWTAQSHANELVGLDFGPFTGSQDPADHYVARRPVVHGSECSVPVSADSPTDTATKSNTPAVVAELVLHNRHWVFTDFRYQDTHSSLLQILAELRHERAKHPSAH